MKRSPFGYVKFMLFGSDCENFFTDAVKNGIKIFDVENIKGIYYAKTSPNNYLKLSKLKRNYHIHMKHVGKHGIAFRLNKYKYRYGILLGAAAFSLIVHLCSTIVWDIQITGNERISDDSLTEFLYENGIYPGVSRKEVKTTITELKAILNYKDLAWISIESEGSRINVKVSESINNPDYGLSAGTPCNLVARRDGKIIYSEIHNGTMLYKVGSGVKKGDIVVSGFVTDGDGNLSVHHADAKIIGEFEEEVSYYREFSTIEHLKTDETYTKEYVKLFGFSFPDKRSEYIEGYTYTSDSYEVKLLGLTMPWSIISVKGTKTEAVEIKHSVNDVKRLLQQDLDMYEKNILKDYSIMDRDISYEKDEKGIKVTCKYTLQGDILSQSEIFIRD